MAAIPITVIGSMTRADGTTENVVINGIATAPDTGIWPSPGYPAHPIAPGGPPPSVWPDPGKPTHPIYNPPGIWPSPGRPEHPIVIPPIPPEIWPNPGKPEHPIVLPPDVPVEPPTDEKPPLFLPVFIPDYGWILVPTFPLPGPSKR